MAGEAGRELQEMSPGAPTSEPRTHDRSRRRVDALWVLVLVLAALSVSAAGVLNGTRLSALDEHTHLDYAWKISRGQLPYEGVELSPYTLEQWSCRGQDPIDPVLPACEDAEAGRVEPADYPARGENYNYWHPPLYYATTAAAGSVGGLVGLEFSTAARLSGGLWLAAAVAGMYLLLRRWGITPWVAAAGAGALLSVPVVAHASATVTNDAPAALVGVGALWILTRVFHDGRLGWLAPTLVAALAAGTKLMSAVAVLTAVGVVALSAVPAGLQRRWREAGRRAMIAVGPVLAVAAWAFLWPAYQAGRAVPGWTSPIGGVNTAAVVGAPLDEWAPTLMAVFGLTQDFYVQPEVMSLAITALVGALRVLLTAAPFMAVVAFEAHRPERVLGWAALLGALAVPLLVQGQEFLRGGGYFPTVSTRYGITLVPVTLAALAVVAHARRFGPLMAVLALGGYLVLLLSFTGVL